MKSTINILFALVAFTSASFAETPSNFAVIPNATAGVYKVCYKGAETGKVKLSIYSSNNELVFTETMVNVSSFIRPYNFSQLAEGEYTIVAEDKSGKQVEKVSFRQNKIESRISVSKLAGFDSKYVLSVSNTGSEVVSVRIFNDIQELIHEQVETVKGQFGLIYNLSEVKSKASQITFEVTAGGKTETVTF